MTDAEVEDLKRQLEDMKTEREKVSDKLVSQQSSTNRILFINTGLRLFRKPLYDFLERLT